MLTTRNLCVNRRSMLSLRFLRTCALYGGTLMFVPFAQADTYELPADLELSPDGWSVITPYCTQLKEGDLITHVDGVLVTQKNAASIAKRLSRTLRTVDLVVIHYDTSRTETVSLVSTAVQKVRLAQEAKLAEQQQEAAKREAEIKEKRDEEHWRANALFVDSRGKQWRMDEIETWNKSIMNKVTRAILKHTDSRYDSHVRTLAAFGYGQRDPSLGTQMEQGCLVVDRMKEILALPEGKTLTVPSGETYSSLETFLTVLPNFKTHGKNVELLFRLTPGGEYLIPCRRTGQLLSAEEAWEKALTKVVTKE